MGTSKPATYPAILSLDENYNYETNSGSVGPTEQANLQRIGPHRAANGYLYVVRPWVDGGNNYRVTVQRSTDEGLTWVEMDSANSPLSAPTVSVFRVNAFGLFLEAATDTLWLCHNAPALKITSFSMTTETWQGVKASGGPAATDDFGPVADGLCKIHLVRRSNDSFVVVYSAPHPVAFPPYGTFTFARTWLVTWDAPHGWSVPVNPFNNTGATIYPDGFRGFGPDGAVNEGCWGVWLGCANRVHILEVNDWEITDPQFHRTLWHVSLGCDGLFDTPQVIDWPWLVDDGNRQGSDTCTHPKTINAFAKQFGFGYFRFQHPAGGTLKAQIAFVTAISKADCTFTKEKVYALEDAPPVLPDPLHPGPGRSGYEAISDYVFDTGHKIDLAVKDATHVWLVFNDHENEEGNIFIVERSGPNAWCQPLEIYNAMWFLDSVFAEYIGNEIIGIIFSFSPDLARLNAYYIPWPTLGAGGCGGARLQNFSY